MEKQRIKALLEILGLEQQHFEKLIASLERASYTLGKTAFIRQVSRESGISEDAADEVFILGIFNEDEDPSAFASGIIQAIKESSFEQHLQEESLLKRVRLILKTIYPHRSKFKAFNLYFENKSVFQDSRIITDVRHVFNDNSLTKTGTALLFHVLRINYKEDEIKKDFFVSLEQEDLENLKESIYRAEEKTKQLLSDGSLVYINQVS